MALCRKAHSPSQASSGFTSFALSKTGPSAVRLAIGGTDSTFKGVFDSSGNADEHRGAQESRLR